MTKKGQLTYALFLLLLLVSCKSETAKITDESAHKNAIVDSTITAFQKKLVGQQIDSVFTKTDFNGGISVQQKDVTIYERFQGFENFKMKRPLDSNSVFAIGSVSKQFAAALIMVLEEKGKLSTPDRVSKFLPEYHGKAFENVTIHQLLTHTSGISDIGPGLQSKPGAEFNYSNKGYRMLGEIIEAASGKSYDENARELFADAGLTNTHTAENFRGENHAGAHTGTKNNFNIVENMPRRLSHPSISTAAGGILSTASDLHRWNRALYSGHLLQPTSLKKFVEHTTGMTHPILSKVGYGYGIMLGQQPLSYLHTGYVNGSPSLNIYYPNSGTSVVILSNIADIGTGKKAIFNPHKQVKEIADLIEITLLELKSGSN